MYDLKISGGTVVDGTGTDRFVGDVAVTDGVIVHVGPSTPGDAARTIDATGLVVTPASSTATPTTTARSHGTTN